MAWRLGRDEPVTRLTSLHWSKSRREEGEVTAQFHLHLRPIVSTYNLVQERHFGRIKSKM